MRRTLCSDVRTIGIALLSGLIAVTSQALAESVASSEEYVDREANLVAETYFARVSGDAPLIALFHQARSNGRGEYTPIADWLNGLGYRVIAFDQRSGGDRFGYENRTAALVKGPKGFCDAYPDVAAGVRIADQLAGDAPLVIAGSSYSASLMWRAALETETSLAGVMAFSTATGGPLDKCGAKPALKDLAAKDVKLRAIALWPDREKKQAEKLRGPLEEIGAEVVVVDNGVHGASMLVDERTKNDMSAARAMLAEWLAKTSAREGDK